MSWIAIAARLLEFAETAIFGYFVLVNGFYALLLASAVTELWRHTHAIRREGRRQLLGSTLVPRISVLAPAHNEAATIVDSVTSLLTLNYPNLEVIVVNDGSRDDTLEILRERFALVPLHPIFCRRLNSAPVRGLYRSRTHPGLVVVDKDNGGKADALNAGLNIAEGELVCAIDSDSLIEPDALLRMLRPFLERDDVLAAGGVVRVANGSDVRRGRLVEAHAPRTPLPGIQAVEYLRACLVGRLGWNRLGGNLIISGAFGLFDRQAVVTAGGYAHGSVGEDMELVVRMRRRGYERGERTHVAFVPDPVAWTEVPETVRVLGRQRDRWHRGLTDTLWRHRRVLLNPRYGAMGLVVFPYFVFVELLAPIVEALGLVGLCIGLATGVLDGHFALLFFLAAYGLALVLTLATLLAEEVTYHRYGHARDRLRLLVWALIENLGYRQLTVLWRLQGLVRYLRGRTEWGAMERRGLGRAAGGVAPAAKPG